MSVYHMCVWSQWKSEEGPGIWSCYILDLWKLEVKLYFFEMIRDHMSFPSWKKQYRETRNSLYHVFPKVNSLQNWSGLLEPVLTLIQSRYRTVCGDL